MAVLLLIVAVFPRGSIDESKLLTSFEGGWNTECRLVDSRYFESAFDLLNTAGTIEHREVRLFVRLTMLVLHVTDVFILEVCKYKCLIRLTGK